MAEVMTRGTGEHEQLADRAMVRVTFAARGADRSSAVAALGPRVPTLDLLGVEVRLRRVDVHTAWERTRRAGCTAQLTLVLRVTRVDAVEEVLDALVAAEPESLSGPHWELTDDAAAVAVAQQRAVADARRRAQLRYCVKLLDARCSEQVRAEPFSAVGGLAEVAGYMAYDRFRP